MLAACCVGWLAEEAAGDDGSTVDPAEVVSALRVKWDEKDIAVHDAQRGIAFGTMTIDQTDTPYL